MPHRSVQVWELGMVIGAVDQGGEGGGKEEHPHRDSPPPPPPPDVKIVTTQ